MGVTNELGVPLSPEAMNILQSHIDKNFSRNVSINLVIKFYFFFKFNFCDIKIHTIDCQWHSYGFWRLGWVT